ncbi:MAG TPA: hypothetical protein VH396_19920 [Chitinophagaceae bacterium]
MNKSILISIFILANSLFLHAQNKDTLTCGFETLFTIKTGMSKAEVMDLVNNKYQSDLPLVKTQVEKLPPYKGSSGDSIVKEILSYKPNFSQCFHGRNTMVQLEFADDKLYKAYISTEYPKTAYQDMMTNYSFLRNVIKGKWASEKATKLSGENIVGFGYDYTKPKTSANKTEKVSLQYVDSRVNNQGTPYILEVLWANLTDTRMQNSNY